MTMNRGWMYAAAGLLWVGWGQSLAVERAQPSAVARSHVAAPLSQAPGRAPSPAMSRLSVSGRLQVTTDLGVPASDSVIVEDRGAGGYLDVMQGSRQDLAGAPQIEVLGGGRYRVTVATSDMLPTGMYRGTLRLRMCTETPCVHPIANASASAPYRIDVAWANPGEWEMFQRDAAHTGYVPIALRAPSITKLWERHGYDGTWGTGPSGVTTAPGRAYASFRTDDALYSRWMLSALDSKTGSIVWRQDFGDFFALNGPSVKGDRVYVATTGGSLWTYLWSFDAVDGTLQAQSLFESQHASVLAPTIWQGIAYTNGGYYGGGTYAFDADDGMPLWSAFSGEHYGSTPAVSDAKVYYFDGNALLIYDAVDGELIGRIADPNPPSSSTPWLNSAPMLGSSDHVIAQSRNTTVNGRFLVDYSPAADAARWSTTKRYSTHPATAHGVIYAGSSNPLSFDAIDEDSGQVLWSWLPEGTDTKFRNNVVLTRNLAFVSTDRAVYAIDLATRRAVWSYPVPGTLSISGDGMLYLLTGQFSSGRLLAFRIY